MKRKLFSIIMFTCLLFVSCKNNDYKIDSDLVLKISEAYENVEPIRYSELVDKLGNPTVDLAVGEVEDKAGWCIWANDFTNKTELDQAFEENKEISALVVLFLAGDAFKATYYESYSYETYILDLEK